MSLIAQYKFDETAAADVAVDEQGNYPLTPITPPAVASGRAGNARKWTANGQVLQSAAYPAVFADPAGKWSLGFWLAVNDETVLASSTLFSVRRLDTSSHHLARIYLTNSGTKIYGVNFVWSYAAGSQEGWVPNIGAIQAAGVWHHHLLTRNGKSFNWYVGGTLVEAHVMVNAVLAEAYTYVMSLGRGQYDAFPSNLNGVSVDDFRIYDHELSAAEAWELAWGNPAISSAGDAGLAICNRALMRIGHSKPIASLTEDSEEARACAFLYPICRDELLAAYEWRFAKRIAVLAESSIDAQEPWGYAYRLPSDCLVPRYIWPGVRNPAVDERIPFEMSTTSDLGTPVLLTDVEPDPTGDPAAPQLVYTAKVVSTAAFPVLFSDALAWRMAVDLSMALGVKRELRIDAARAYELALQRAQVLAAIQGTPDVEADSIFLRSRQ